MNPGDSMLVLKKIYRKFKKLILIHKKRYALRSYIQNSSHSINIVIGAGNTQFDKWISTNINLLNLLRKKDWKFYFSKKKPHKLLAEHVLEHLTYRQTKEALQNTYNFLHKGGTFRIAVPDANNCDPEYISAVRPNGWDVGADDHKSFWKVDPLTDLAKSVGFEVIKLEYYDKHHQFNISAYTNENGYITRSRKHNYVDKNVPNFNSLILDLIKPIDRG